MISASHRVGIGVVLGVLLFLEVLPADAREPSQRTRAEFAERKIKALVAAGVEHIEVGKWCRDSGMIPQATAEFLRAVEVSENKLQWAKNIVALMQRLDDRFWKWERKRPSAVMLRSYDKKTTRARVKIQKGRLALAKWATKKGLVDEALAEYQAVIALSDRAIELDGSGRIKVEAGVFPKEISARLCESAVRINDKLYVRDAFLQRVPDVGEIFEVENERMLVRSQNSLEEAERILAMGTALLPYLEADLGGRPTRRLNAFVFRTRADYATYCESSGLSAHVASGGVADRASNQTLVCAEDLPNEAVSGMALHELTHLFQFGVTRAVMPSWHSEGLAETWGGEGTFAWDGESLTAGGAMASSQIEPIKGEGYLPVAELLKGDALTLINEDRGRARHFYAESWAWLTFLRHHASKDVRRRFERWEATCMGAALGAEAGKHESRNQGPAAQLFQRAFGEDLDEVEAAFRAWLQEQ